MRPRSALAEMSSCGRGRSRPPACRPPSRRARDRPSRGASASCPARGRRESRARRSPSCCAAPAARSDVTTASPRLPRYVAPAVGPTSVTVGAGGAQRLERAGQLAIFEFVFDEHRDALARQTRPAMRLIVRFRSQMRTADLKPLQCHNAYLMNRLARERSPVPAAARRTIPSTGFPGATRRSRRRAPKTSRSFCRSATRRATGAT